MPVASSAAAAAVSMHTTPANAYDSAAAGPAASIARPASRKMPAPIMVPAPIVSALQNPRSR